MPIQYKVDVIAKLKEAGFTSYRIRREALINQTALQRIRQGKMISWDQLAAICKLLQCQPGDLVEFVDDDPPANSISPRHVLCAKNTGKQLVEGYAAR